MLIDDTIRELAIESISEYIGILTQISRKKNNKKYKKYIEEAEKKVRIIIDKKNEKEINKILYEYNRKLKILQTME